MVEEEKGKKKEKKKKKDANKQKCTLNMIYFYQDNISDKLCFYDKQNTLKKYTCN